MFVIDNQGRTDEACIGDLTVIEAQSAGHSGMLVWGLHRDTTELLNIEVPVLSYGTCSAGPRRADEPEPDALVSAQFGDFNVTGDHCVFADDDGAVFVATADVDAVLDTAQTVRATEEEQAELVRRGSTLRDQLGFAD